MQKTSRLLLATLALLGSSAVLAQSSVTLYGRVNTTMERQKTGNVSNTVMQNNSSRIGFKGVEDLGGGLKAGFQLEAGFGSDDGSGPLAFRRQSEVNLSGGFGMLRLGHFTPESYFATADYISMHNHDTGTSSDALYFDPVWNAAAAPAVPNKIAYRTPNLGGFTVEGAVSLHEQATGGKNGYDLAANYNLGSLALGAGYSKLDKDYQAALRGLYGFGPVTLGAYFQRNHWDVAGNRNNVRLSAMYALGASEFHANIGRAGNVGGVSKTGATQWTLGYNYNLSKRTKVYGFYTKVNNQANANYMTGTNDVDFSSVAVGLRHNF